jgi:hypothetical protein
MTQGQRDALLQGEEIIRSRKEDDKKANEDQLDRIKSSEKASQIRLQKRKLSSSKAARENRIDLDVVAQRDTAIVHGDIGRGKYAMK